MDFYRNTWPKETVTPKLHMLEDHAVDFIRKWGIGMGFYAEQGGESIHPVFNNLLRSNGQLKPATKRLATMINIHHANTNPEARKMKPEIVRRKRKFEE